MGYCDEPKKEKVNLHATAMERNVAMVVSTKNMTGSKVSALASDASVKLNFVGYVCHVFNAEAGINLEA